MMQTTRTRVGVAVCIEVGPKTLIVHRILMPFQPSAHEFIQSKWTWIGKTSKSS